MTLFHFDGQSIKANSESDFISISTTLHKNLGVNVYRALFQDKWLHGSSDDNLEIDNENIPIKPIFSQRHIPHHRGRYGPIKEEHTFMLIKDDKHPPHILKLTFRPENKVKVLISTFFRVRLI